MSFLQLPKELVSYVSQYLSIPQALKIGILCKELYDARPYDLPLARILEARKILSAQEIPYISWHSTVLYCIDNYGEEEVQRILKTVDPVNLDGELEDLLTSIRIRAPRHNVIKLCEMLLLFGDDLSKGDRQATESIVRRLFSGSMNTIGIFSLLGADLKVKDANISEHLECFRACHLNWHVGIDAFPLIFPINYLEEYIRLAIFTDRVKIYSFLINLRSCFRPRPFPVIQRLSCSCVCIGKHHRQDVIEAIRCNSNEILEVMNLPGTEELKCLKYICGKTYRVGPCSLCCLCFPVPSIQEMQKKAIEEISSLSL